MSGGPVIDVFTSGEGGWECYKIPTLFTTHSNTLIAIAEARGGDCMDWQDTDLVLKRSFDNGNTWPEEVALVVPGGYDRHNVAGNIGIVQDKETGRIWMPFARGNWEFAMTYSDDDGATWIEPYTEGIAELQNSMETWVGFGPPAGMQSASGRLVLPAYASIMPIYDNGIFTYSFIVYSDDNGETWQRTDNIPTEGLAVFSGAFGNEAQIVELQNPQDNSWELLINSRAAWGHRIQSYSKDDGTTWSNYEETTLPMPTLGCEGSLLAPGGDKVLFSGPDNMDILRIDLTVWESEDRGATYKNAFEVDVDSANVGYSSMAQLHDGSVAILWGRALTASTFFVPDFVSFRMLPAELSGPAVDASPWATGSGEAHSMDWQEGYSFTQFKGTGGWWAIYLLNYVLVATASLWALRCFVQWLKSVLCKSNTLEEQRLMEEEGGGGRTGVFCRCVGHGILTFLRVLSLALCMVGVGAQAAFELDDGDRWMRQSLNVMGYIVFHLLCVEMLPCRWWKARAEAPKDGAEGMELTGAVSY